MGLCREYALLSDAGPHPYVDQLQRIQCLLQDVGKLGFHLILIITTYSTNPMTLTRQLTPCNDPSFMLMPMNGSSCMSLLVFLVSDPKQNARSLLTPVFDPAFHALGSIGFFFPWQLFQPLSY